MFQGCVQLKRIAIPKEVIEYGDDVFQACYSLEKIAVSDSVVEMGVEIFKDCNSLKKLYLSSNIGTAYSQSFLSSCYSLANLTIKSNIQTLNTLALNYIGLGELHFESSTPPTAVDNKVFRGLSTKCKIYVPSGRRTTYMSTTNYPNPNEYTYIEEA